ncbi:MAG: nucleotide exchange factor GrpE [Tissierellia bacterium]|nr:nucleotide exchange factor GrpE [Tissierellia bacterium]
MENKEKKEETIKEEKVEDQETKEKLEIDFDKVEDKKEMEENEKGKLEEKEKVIEDLNNKLLRLQADFIDYKNRVEREKTSIYANAAEEIILQILPILDNFERALHNMDDDNTYYEGVKMIYDQLIDVLSKNGLKEIDCENKAFDPNYHHAVLAEEVEGKEEGIIVEVLQKGYMLNDKVIRPSMVKVAK